MGFGQLTLELILGFFSLLFMTRILGKTQITQLTAFDFISALIMGELLVMPSMMMTLASQKFCLLLLFGVS